VANLSRVPDLPSPAPDAPADGESSPDAARVWNARPEATTAPLPDADDLAGELRRLREKGLLRARELPLPALEAVAQIIDDTQRPVRRRLEIVLRKALDRMGSDEFGLAAGTLFGLAQGTIGTRPTDLRERAATVFGLSAETFRKDRERQIIARLAEELLILAELAVAGGTTVPPASIVAAGPAETTTTPGARSPGLPRENTVFVGRDIEFTSLIDALTPDDEPQVCAVHGMAGVGKTALAVRAAHRLRSQFPDGVIFVDLSGYSVDRPPEHPSALLDRLLRQLSVSAESIPAHLDDKSALWTSLLAERRLLLVLDNARDVTQVLPLLPSTSDCGVIITSRNRMTGLDEARHVLLGVLPRDDSVELFRQIAGIAHPTGEDGAHGSQGPVREDPPGSPSTSVAMGLIAERCADLPLAVRIVAARYRVNPFEELGQLLHRLTDEHGRLSELDDGNRSIAAAFAVSQADLPDDVRRHFEVLGLHPGADLSAANTSALLGCGLVQARRVLEVLVDRHLLDRTSAERYRFHDLVAAFARRQAFERLPADIRTDAFRRLTDDYLTRAAAADEKLTPHRFPIALDLVFPPTEPVPPVSYAEALDWVRAEEANLVAVGRAAGQRGLDRICWQLAYTLRGYFFLTKSWSAWQISHEAALSSAIRLGDRWAEATTLNNLGLCAVEQDQLDLATARYQTAGVLFAQLEDEQGQFTAQANLAWVRFAQGRYEQFLAELGGAYEFYRRQAMTRNAAISLRGMALGEVALGRPERAVGQLQESLAIFRDLDLRLDVSIALNNLGEAHAAEGEPAAARQSHLEALAAARHCHSDFEAARAQARLADLDDAADDHPSARVWRTAALKLYQKLRAPQAVALRNQLDELDESA
jgi:tetratricopeptide (TPR) repeat protein